MNTIVEAAAFILYAGFVADDSRFVDVGGVIPDGMHNSAGCDRRDVRVSGEHFWCCQRSQTSKRLERLVYRNVET